MAMQTTLIIRLRIKAFPKAFCAIFFLFLPRALEIIDALPTPIIVPMPIMINCMGSIIESAAMASEPTPLPTNIVSVILYKAPVTIPMIAGAENLNSKLFILPCSINSLLDFMLLHHNDFYSWHYQQSNYVCLLLIQDILEKLIFFCFVITDST